MKKAASFFIQNINLILDAPFVQLLFTGIWLSNLTETDSEFSIYVLCTVCSAMCIVWLQRNRRHIPRGICAGIIIAAGVFSGLVLLANYALFMPLNPFHLIKLLFTFLSGFCVGRNILTFLYIEFPRNICCESRPHGPRIFLLSFCSLTTIYLGYQYYMNYPGTVSSDSLNQITQFFTGEYSNFNPIYHTLFLRLLYQIGFSLFGQINGAIGFAMSVQCVLLALCFSYSVVTIYQMGVPKWLPVAAFVFYGFMPYHIVYASTMWKDVLFGASAILLLSAFLRIFRGIGKNRILNKIVFIIGSTGFSLMRTNGWYALMVAAILFLIFLRKEYTAILKILGAVLLCCWIALNPVLDFLGIKKLEPVEAFSIPLQQISFVIANGGELTEEEERLLSIALDFEVVKAQYEPGFVDPVKWNAIRWKNLDHVQDNFDQYVSLYLKMAVKYPGSFLKAWSDQTKGFWNGGYVTNSHFGLYYPGVTENNFGITQEHREGALPNAARAMYTTIFSYIENSQLFRPLFGIGLAVWMFFACSLLCLWNHRKSESLLCIPIFVLIIGLWFGTPVFSEFRYAYPVFTTLPLIIAASLYSCETSSHSA